jgi:hypothetical protein
LPAADSGTGEDLEQVAQAFTLVGALNLVSDPSIKMWALDAEDFRHLTLGDSECRERFTRLDTNRRCEKLLMNLVCTSRNASIPACAGTRDARDVQIRARAAQVLRRSRQTTAHTNTCRKENGGDSPHHIA